MIACLWGRGGGNFGELRAGRGQCLGLSVWQAGAFACGPLLGMSSSAFHGLGGMPHWFGARFGPMDTSLGHPKSYSTNSKPGKPSFTIRHANEPSSDV